MLELASSLIAVILFTYNMHGEIWHYSRTGIYIYSTSYCNVFKCGAYISVNGCICRWNFVFLSSETRMLLMWLFSLTFYYYYYYYNFLLTVHLSIFISVINQLDAQNFCFTISLFHASTCFEHMLETCRGMK